MGGGVTLSLEGRGGLEGVQPDLGVGRAGPQARRGQSKPCAAAKPGQDPHRPWAFEGLREAEPYPGARKAPAHLSLPSLSRNTHCQHCLLRDISMGAGATRVPILPLSSTCGTDPTGQFPAAWVGRGVDDEGVVEQM